MTVWRVIHDDLSLKTYRKFESNELNSKEKFAFELDQKKINHKSCRSIIFFDKKWFDQDSQYNRQNDCVYAKLREAANGTRPMDKLPFKAMIWPEITFNGDCNFASENEILWGLLKWNIFFIFFWNELEAQNHLIHELIQKQKKA